MNADTHASQGRQAARRLWHLFAQSWPTVLLLAVMRAVWLLALPAAVVSVGTRVPVLVPIAVGVVFDAFGLLLQQRLRYRLRTSCMTTGARDALEKRGGVPESQTDATFWSAYLSEYAVSSDVPAILAASAATLGILGLATVRMGPSLVLPIAAILGGLGVLGFLLHRHLTPRLRSIVERRATVATWLAAAERDAGEIGGTCTETPFLRRVTEATGDWCQAEDGYERRQVAQRFLLLLMLGLAVAGLLSARGIDWLNLALADQGVQVSVREVADLVLLAASLPVAIVAARHANALLTAHGELRELHPPRAHPRLAPAPWQELPRKLVIRDLVVRYGDHVALRIPAWEGSLARPLAILGSNGAGKSTLASVLAGVLTPSEGDVLVGGVSSVRIDREAVAFVPQDPVLIESLTIAENLRLVAPGTSDEAASRLLKELGLEKPLDRKAGELSRGERRRIAIARALLKDPKLLILDEPDSWLDAAGRQLLAEVLKKEAHCRSMVIVSHRTDLLPEGGTRIRLTPDHEVESA